MTQTRILRVRRALIVAVFASLILAAAYQTGSPGSLELTITDDGQPAPARVELLDSAQKGYIAEDAVPTGGDCSNCSGIRECPGIPPDILERVLRKQSKTMANYYAGTNQFYSTGKSRLVSLPAGSYRLRVYKGFEFQVVERTLRIRAGENLQVTVPLVRWIDMTRQGWYSADDHLHIPRPASSLNPSLSKWMQAEDVRVANLLQMGDSRQFQTTPQYAFGKQSWYHEGDYWLATAQENPRTYIRGHGIVLGADSPIDFPSSYLIYSNFWKEAKRQGALSGYAHYGAAVGGSSGLAIDLPSGLLNFLEVLQFNVGEQWWAWYEILNTGFRLTPTAGTDYPCFPSYPGCERFYTKVDGRLTYDSWLKGVRRGTTFVTNGPMLEFRVAGKEMGDEVTMEKPGTVTVEGRIRFDPARDSIHGLELIEKGEVIRTFPRLNNADEISFRVPYEVRGSSWLAIRTRGQKLGESNFRFTVAHSAPVYITLKNAPPLSQQSLAKDMARVWLARLADLEARLAEDRIPYLLEPIGLDMTEAVIRRDRSALLREIASARAKYLKLVQ